MASPGDSLLILIPAFNDWEALGQLLPRIERAMQGSSWHISVLIVDDASTEPADPGWPGQEFTAIGSVTILHLRCNLGHQRAIAIGLYYAHEFARADAVLVMDGDGEDRAEDLPALLAEFERAGRREAVFAARTKRMESFTFQFFYQVYRLVHHVLTGVEVRAGNFSVLPGSALRRLMAVSDLWNHYAAAVYRARLPRRLLPLPRGHRLEGKSRMNFVNLLIHGLAAISVFSEQVSARLLAAAVVFALLGLGIVLRTGLGTPAVVLLAIAAQTLTFAVLFTLTIVSRRSSVNFLLLRDAPYFILDKTIAAEKSSLYGLGAALAREEGFAAKLART